MNIYLVCTGNTCRSPMAEAILRSRNNDQLKVRSGGIYAADGAPISTNAKILIEEEGMPYTPVSRAVTAADVDWADVILTMTVPHKDALLHLFPQASHKINTLKGFVEPGSLDDVHDPFGGSLATYKKTFDELTSLIELSEGKLIGGVE